MISKLVRSKFRVKIKSLAEESRIIRVEERRHVGPKRDFDRGVLHWHRVGVLRQEQRATYLAYALVRGVPYATVEKEGAKPSDFVVRRISEICNSLAWRKVSSEDIASWMSGIQKENAA
jgi:hypothetical protein